MALVLRGGSAVIWSQHQDAFPYIKGMLVIFLSWVCSPIASGAVAKSVAITCSSASLSAAAWPHCCCLLLAASRTSMPDICVLAGIVCFGLFISIRFIILRSPTGYKRAFWVSRNAQHHCSCSALCCDCHRANRHAAWLANGARSLSGTTVMLMLRMSR